MNFFKKNYIFALKPWQFHYLFCSFGPTRSKHLNNPTKSHKKSIKIPKMGRPESNTTTIPETSHENLMKILKMSRPESNTTKIPYIKIYKNPKKTHENPKTWGKVARAQICFFPLNRAYINRILHFLSSITFSKNFKLTIKNINYLLNRRPYIPTQHTVPQAHYFFQAQHHCNIFR